MNLSRTGQMFRLFIGRVMLTSGTTFMYHVTAKNRPAVGRISRLAEEDKCPIHAEPLQYDYEQ